MMDKKRDLFCFWEGEGRQVSRKCLKSSVDSAVLMSASKSYLTLCDPMSCSPPVTSVHRILQVRILEWTAV